ncbi:hypothetical protein G5S_0282 [Chlamydia pecorum E58]|uniref:Uncharacterized protein n=1 Tax=Chlamydia pecorum (strain ATCC VR-628 / DSM 29919 / E58) TaxID=331635 RepID=A0AA34RCN0_CHLPE|nr:hypothetical protein G5S_0282 [Chlamydia pecorum E58]
MSPEFYLGKEVFDISKDVIVIGEHHGALEAVWEDIARGIQPLWK